MVRKEGQEINFSFPTDQSQGDPVYIYAFNKMSEMDFSDLANFVYEGSFKFVLGTDLVQNTMKKLVIGNPNVRNTTNQDTTTWSKLPNLEYLDITNYEGITSVPLASFNNLHTFKAAGSKLGAFAPAEGSVFDKVELPSSIKTISMTDISFKRSLAEDFSYTPNTNLDSLTLSNSSKNGIGLDYYRGIILPWVNAINASAQASLLYLGKSLSLTNVQWSFNSLDSIRIFKNFKNSREFQISGKIDLRPCGSLTMENIDEIKDIFGENCFNERLSPLYVMTPDSVFIQSDSASMVAGKTNIFRRTIYPDERAIIGNLVDLRYYIVEETTISKDDAGDRIIFKEPITGQNYMVIENLNSVRRGLTLENTVDESGKQIGVLSSTETVVGHDDTFLVLVNMKTLGDASIDKISIMNFTVKDPTYGDRGTISGSKSLYKNNEYSFVLSPMTADGVAPIGSYTVSWSLTGTAVNQYVESYNVNENDQLELIVKMNQDQPEISSKMTVVANVTNYDGTTYRVSYAVLSLNDSVIMTRDSNPVAMNACYNAGYASNEDAMTKQEAEAVTNLGTTFKGIRTAYTFDELAFFTGLTSISVSAFTESLITEVVIPETVTSIGQYAFAGCSSLSNVYIEKREGNAVTMERTLPSGITVIKEGTFAGCSSLTELVLPEGITTIENYAFGKTGFRRVIMPSTEIENGDLKLPESITRIEGNAFEVERWSPETTANALRHFEIPKNLTIPNFAIVRGRYIESFVVDEENSSYKVGDNGELTSKSDLALNILRYPALGGEVETYYLPIASFVEPYAFFAVKNVKNVIATEGSPIRTIGEGVFMESEIENIDLTNCVGIANGLIPNDACRSCSKLLHFHFPAGSVITKIGTHAFDGCTELEEIELPTSLAEFGMDTYNRSFTFVGCRKITGVTFPDTVTVMGRKVLGNMSRLKKIVFPAYFRYTEGKEAGQGAERQWVGFAVAEDCPNVESVTLPAFTVTSTNESGETGSTIINKWVYNGVWYLSYPTPDERTVAIDGLGIVYNGLTNVKEYLISDKDNGEAYVSVNGILYTANKKTIVIGPKVLNELVVEDGTENIGAFAFKGSTLSKVVLPEGFKTIGYHAFEGCSSLEEINIPYGLESVGENGLSGVRVKEYNFGPNIQLGGHSLRDNPVLTTVRMRVADNGGSGEALGKFAFTNCPNLKDVYVSCAVPPIMPTTEENGNPDQFPWHQFMGAGTNYSEDDRKLYVSYNTSDLYFTDDYNEENGYIAKSWGWLFKERLRNSNSSRTIIDGFPLSGYAYVTIFQNGTPFTGNIVYAKSAAEHLVGTNGSVYSTTVDDGKYMFELDKVYDNERITIYSDAACTNAIGSFVPRLFDSEYQVGEPVLGLRKSSARAFSATLLGAAAEEPDVEMADITKEEYDALVSKVNQMMRILKKMMK